MPIDEIMILGTTIPLASDRVRISRLKFLKDNPRVYSCTHGQPNFDELIEEQQQQIIYEKLLQEPSVKNLIREVKRHGGLMEPILIRNDTMQVIEGNSRLAVYHKLNDSNVEGEWDSIPCRLVCSLTEEQQVAFLNQIHVKGKTQWSAYEKANFAYVRRIQGWDYEQIATLFGESSATIRTRCKVIDMMKENQDGERSHFSYYDVLVRNRPISMGVQQNHRLRDVIHTRIRHLGSDEDNNDFTAQELRKKLPVILTKPKALRKYISGAMDLDKSYQVAKISHVEEKLKQARELLADITRQDVRQLEHNDYNACKYVLRKLKRTIARITNMIEVTGA